MVNRKNALREIFFPRNRINENLAFLGRNGRWPLKLYYLTGVLVRIFILYGYFVLVSNMLFWSLNDLGVDGLLVKAFIYLFAFSVLPLVVLSLRRWLTATLYWLISTAALTFFYTKTLHFKFFSYQFENGVIALLFLLLFLQLFFLVPLAYLQFSVTKRKALKVRRLPARQSNQAVKGYEFTHNESLHFLESPSSLSRWDSSRF